MKDRATTISGLLGLGLLGLVIQAEPAGAQQHPDGSEAGAPPFAELNEALAAARARLDELASAAEIAERANALRQRVQALEGEKAELASQLKDTRAARRAAERWAQQSEAELAEIQERVEQLANENAALSEASDRALATADRLRQQLQRAKDETAQAIGARNAAESRLVDMQEVIDAARSRMAAVEGDLSNARDELDTTEQALADERRAHEDTQAAVRELRNELTAREDQLSSAEQQLSAVRDQNQKLEREAVTLRQAADDATDVARQNLLAMENKIRLLNATLAEVGSAPEVEPAAGPEGAGGPEEQPPANNPGSTPAPEARGPSGPIQAALTTQRRGTRIDGIPLPPVAKPGPSRRELGVVRSANASPLDDGLQAIKEHEAERATLSLAQLTASLPLERRMHAQSLVADLDAEMIDGGLSVTVPGAELFSLNSEQIEDRAYDTLGKLAELLSIYDDRKVVITGHTDAMGDAGYNHRLSERRAELVRDFFVDEFDVEARRLDIQGAGEEHPIASNATLQGRQANRRVEVTILN